METGWRPARKPLLGQYLRECLWVRSKRQWDNERSARHDEDRRAGGDRETAGALDLQIHADRVHACVCTHACRGERQTDRQRGWGREQVIRMKHSSWVPYNQVEPFSDLS